ncbi:MAG: hypothetical protein N3D72_01175 [Candidatus Methanomethyliaceae archaeon]|nr:hypothetical protein [Candidatus Methanomethyliaceae archaeon]
MKDLMLKKFNESSRFLDPRKEFMENEQEIEIRIDPVTGVISRINMNRVLRPKQKIDELKYSCDYCPFCPDNIERDTPKFTREYFEEGRIKVGGAMVFPNLFPLAELHGVCVFTPKHKLNIIEIDENEIFDGLRASMEFFLIGRRKNLLYHFLGWNHLSSAGASILHPHFQLICSRVGLNYERIIFEASERYWKEKGKSYWRELMKDEERYIGESEGITWIAPWAPMGNFEVIGISTEGISSIMRSNALRGIASGIVKILKAFWSLGIRSINMGVFSYPEQKEWFSFHIRIIARSDSPNDRGFLEIFCGEIGVLAPPEIYSKYIRNFFK